MKSELQVFQDYIHNRELRRTPERERILQEVFEIHGHFDVDGLYLQLRQKGVKVSKASIYRALPLFIDCGLVREVDFSEGHWHYEHIYGHSHHNHLRCLRCGEIQEFENQFLHCLEEQLAREYGYQIKGHHLQVEGFCPACRQAKDDTSS
ncbi:MAG: transcriptional repressor [Deltaproteobacteria bacterium]|nr:transcriptional repressor [Deltaproteobacteria bacterium]